MLKGSTAFNTLGRVAIRRSTERFIESFRMLLRVRAALGPCVWNFMARCHEKWPCHEMPRNRYDIGGTQGRVTSASALPLVREKPPLVPHVGRLSDSPCVIVEMSDHGATEEP